MSLASFFGGVLADRYDRRKLLIAAQSVTTCNLLALAALTIAGSVALWHIYLSAIGLGLMQSVTMPARSALVRSLVDDASMVNAVALNAVQQQSSRIIWPSLAGGLIALAGAGATLAVSAAASFVGIVCIVMIGVLPATPKREGRLSHAAEMREGVRYTFSEPGVSTLMWLCIAVGLFGLAFMNLAPAFAREDLESGAERRQAVHDGVRHRRHHRQRLAPRLPDQRRTLGIHSDHVRLCVVIFLMAAVPLVPITFMLMGVWGMVSAIGVTGGQTYRRRTCPNTCWAASLGCGAWRAAWASLRPCHRPPRRRDRPALRSAAWPWLLAVLTLWFDVIAPKPPTPVSEPATASP